MSAPPAAHAADAARAALAALCDLGYAIAAEGGRLRLRYQHDGTPPADAVRPLLATLGAHKAQALRLVAGARDDTCVTAGTPLHHCTTASPDAPLPGENAAAPGGAPTVAVAGAGPIRGDIAVARGDGTAPASLGTTTVSAPPTATPPDTAPLSGDGPTSRRVVQWCSGAAPPADTMREQPRRTTASGRGLAVRWAAERGWLRVLDRFGREWHEVRAKDAPAWMAHRASAARRRWRAPDGMYTSESAPGGESDG